MSRAVDVLRAMDAAAQEIAYLAERVNVEGNPYDLQEARAAVAELIEAANGIMDPHNPTSINAQYDRLLAAIARATGEKP